MGKKNLERALAAAKPRLVSKDTTFTTTWRPFFLMPPEMWRRGVESGEFPPDAETVGINKLDYYHSKFGGPARVAPMVERLAGIMRSLDVEYNMDGNTGPTLDGHRIAAYAERAEGLDKQNAFMEEIFKSYFTMAQAPATPRCSAPRREERGWTRTRWSESSRRRRRSSGRSTSSSRGSRGA